MAPKKQTCGTTLVLGKSIRKRCPPDRLRPKFPYAGVASGLDLHTWRMLGKADWFHQSTTISPRHPDVQIARRAESRHPAKVHDYGGEIEIQCPPNYRLKMPPLLGSEYPQGCKFHCGVFDEFILNCDLHPIHSSRLQYISDKPFCL
jgi:hypothetical protein